MTNQVFQESETEESQKRPEWMERAQRLKIGGDQNSSKGMPYLADGARPAFRVRRTVVEATPLPEPRKRAVFGKRTAPEPAMMADGKRWAGKAFARAGETGHSLHATLGIPKDKKIPASRLEAATHSGNEHTRHMAQAAKNIRP